MKTLVILNGQIQGVTEEVLTIGDVISLDEGNLLPLVVYLVQDKPSKIGYNPAPDSSQLIIPLEQDDSKAIDIEWEGDYEKIAYLSYNEKAGAKYTKKTSQKLEKRMAKSLGGNTTVGSGAFVGHKGDAQSKEWLGEHKFTDAKSYRLQRTIWEKIAREAFQISKIPLLEIILDQDKTHLRMIYMDLNDFGEKTRASEEQLTDFFLFYQLKSKPGKNSINLEVEPLQNFINTTLIAIDDKRVPAVLLTFDEHRTLLGLLAKDWETIFAPDEQPPEPKKQPRKSPKSPRPKIERPKVVRPKAPKTKWPKRPFPTRKKINDE